MNSKSNIELKGEKVRSIIGKIPPNYMRYGILYISLTIICTICILNFIRIPQYKDYSVNIITDPETFKFNLPYDVYISNFDNKEHVINKNDTICMIRSMISSDSLYIIAPFNGEIEYYSHENSFKKANTNIFSLLPSEIKKVYAVALIPTTDALLINESQDVIVNILGNHDIFSGKVSFLISQDSLTSIYIDIKDFNINKNQIVTSVATASFIMSEKSILEKIIPIL